MIRLCSLALGLVMQAICATADTALIAVATNFLPVAQALAPGFTAATGHEVTIIGGATGKLYAQIAAGAPFDALLSADAATPARLQAEALGVPGSAFTYAIGALALYSADPARFGPSGPDGPDDAYGADGVAALADPSLRFVAIANPDLAPYGLAARETLQVLGLWDALQRRIVMGQNVGAAFALTHAGAAELGFVALSAVVAPGVGGSYWVVPQDLYAPLRQDAVLLAHGAENPAARAFLGYLGAAGARAFITAAGYGLDP